MESGWTWSLRHAFAVQHLYHRGASGQTVVMSAIIGRVSHDVTDSDPLHSARGHLHQVRQTHSKDWGMKFYPLCEREKWLSEDAFDKH